MGLTLFNLDMLPARSSVEIDLDGDRKTVRFRAVLLDAKKDVHVREFPWTEWLPWEGAPFQLRWDELVGERRML